MDELQKVQPLQNCIIIDWLTFSTKDYSFSDLVGVLGMQSRQWRYEKGSRLRYVGRWVCGHISIHVNDVDSDSEDKKGFNKGCCVEMSGQGCREFESFGRGDWAFLMFFLWQEVNSLESTTNVTRLDLAYDDFSGVLDIGQIARQAWNMEFTSRMSRVSVISDMSKLDVNVRGISITHGSKSSNVFFRIYDKRVERGRFDLQHWVRWEIQFRDICALGALNYLFTEGSDDFGLGYFFGGLVRHYVQYRDVPSAEGGSAVDTNKSRWNLSAWYINFIGAVEGISVWSKKDVEYNKSRMDRYAYKQNHNHTLTLIQADGIVKYLHQLFDAAHGEEMPQKYKDVLAQFCGSRGRAALDRGLPSDFHVWLDQLRQDLNAEPDAETHAILCEAFASLQSE